MITFKYQRIPVLIGPRRKSGETMPRQEEVDAMVGIDTGMAYHQPPANTILAKKLPDAFMITRMDSHSSLTCSTLPADAPTAEACIAYLAEHWNRQVSSFDLIDSFAQTYGKWCHLTW